MVLQFDQFGTSQRLEALDNYFAPYFYHVQRVEHRDTFLTLTGPITEITEAYYLVNDTDAIVGPGLTLAGAQAVVDARESFMNDALSYLHRVVAQSN